MAKEAANRELDEYVALEVAAMNEDQRIGLEPFLSSSAKWEKE